MSLTEPNRIYFGDEKNRSRSRSRNSGSRNGNSSNETGTPYKEVLLHQTKMNEMKIIHPQLNWDSHYCNSSCDAGRFCIAAIDKTTALNDINNIAQC